MRVWLQEMTGNETGWMAWCLDVHGFATWSSSEAQVLGKVPNKLTEHLVWHELLHLKSIRRIGSDFERCT